MNRALLIFLVALSVSSPAYAGRAPQPGAIFRIHGGTAYTDPQTGSGPGWLAGAAVGFPVKPDVLLLVGFDHIATNRRDLFHDEIGAITGQFELAKPFQGWIEPRLNVGAGIYVRSIDPGYYTDRNSFEFIHGLPYVDAPFGINVGGGVAFLLSRGVTLDLDARHHETVGTESRKSVLTCASAGLTFSLRRSHEPGTWVESDGAAKRYAAR